MHDDTYIPRRLDDPWKIGFWDIDVAAPTILGLFAGYLSGSGLAFMLCVLAGFLASRWVARVKADRHPAFALHCLYWHLPTNPLSAMTATPPSHIRRMVG